MGKKLGLVLNLSRGDIHDLELDINRESTESILFPKEIQSTAPIVNFSQKANVSFKRNNDIPVSQRFQLENKSLFPIPKETKMEPFEQWTQNTVKGNTVDKQEYTNYTNKMITFNADSITSFTDYTFQDSVCWWCCHTIPMNTIPIGMPINYNSVTQKFVVKGIYCSFNCCLANVPRDYTCSRTSSLIYYMYKKCVNKSAAGTAGTQAFKQAPPRQTLALFGGNLSIQEYREYFKTVNMLNISEYPLVYKNFDTTMTSLMLFKKNKNVSGGTSASAVIKQTNKPKGNILDMFGSKNKLKN